MNKLIPPDNIYVSLSKLPNAGRGVFAKKNIKKGETIERCPVIELLGNTEAAVNETILANYIYFLGDKKDKLILVLGYGCIYNHTYQSNARYTYNEKEKILAFIALKDIQEDEEITVNYNQEDKDAYPLWFESIS